MELFEQYRFIQFWIPIEGELNSTQRAVDVQVGKASREGGGSWQAARGRAAHKAFAERAEKKGWLPEPPMRGKDGRLYRPDAVVESPYGRFIMELKPDTPSGRVQVARQLRIYLRQLGLGGRVVYCKP